MPNELAHYASDCWDAEVEIGGDWIEITGFAHRGNYDLSKHNTHSSDDFTMFIPLDEPQKKIQTNLNPDMEYFGPTFGKLAPEILSRIDEMAMSNSNIFDPPEINVDINGTIHSVLSKHLHPTTGETIINGEHILPHVIEPSFGIDRIIYSILAHAFHEDTIDGETRFLLSLPPSIAPTFVGIFPLLTRDNLDVIAQDMASSLRTSGFSVTHDESGSIGKRYRRQDEVGTPFCVTIDHQYFEDHTVTLRERNSATQIRIEANSIPTILESLRNGSSTFSDLV
jgi:glycyl-tRNA synthetase